MTLWMSRLDEHGLPPPPDKECAVCGAPIRASLTGRRRFCADCAGRRP